MIADRKAASYPCSITLVNCWNEFLVVNKLPKEIEYVNLSACSLWNYDRRVLLVPCKLSLKNCCGKSSWEWHCWDVVETGRRERGTQIWTVAHFELFTTPPQQIFTPGDSLHCPDNYAIQAFHESPFMLILVSTLLQVFCTRDYNDWSYKTREHVLHWRG